MGWILCFVPEYDRNKIVTHGFEPHTPFITSDVNMYDKQRLGQKICDANNNPRNNGRYVVFTIDLSWVPKDIYFFTNPTYCEKGILTESYIPYNAVCSVNEITFKK